MRDLRRLPLLLAFPLALFVLQAHAERATERYAPAQIFVARDLLEHARAAAALQEFGTAASYAQQAQVDARIAWGMTDAPALRAQAEAILGEAQAFTTNNRGPAAASYPSPSAQAKVDVPSPR
jgi:hypothetical protein